MKVGSDHDNVENGVTHGAVFMKLVFPWGNTHRIFCADSYLSLVKSDYLIYINGLKFVGVVKIETRKYPMAHLDSQELEKSWDRYVLVKRKTSPYWCDLLEYGWMDQYSRYFIASGSSMDDGDNM